MNFIRSFAKILNLPIVIRNSAFRDFFLASNSNWSRWRFAFSPMVTKLPSLNTRRSLESGPVLSWSCKKSGMPWVAFSGFATPSLDTVADPLTRFISPIISLARADMGKRITSIRTKKQNPCLVAPWVEPGVGILFTMVYYLPDVG